MALINHIGLIPDGNRRWAKINNVSVEKAYYIFIERVYQIVDVVFNQGIKNMSIYLLSKDNLKRGRDDLEPVLNSEIKFLKTLVPEIVKKHDCKIVLAGDINYLNEFEDYKNAVLEICKKSEKNDKHILNLLIGYDPIDELNQAIKKDPENFMHHLWVKEDVTFLMRTGFEKRISNFLPLQCKYAEFDLIKKYLPDVTLEDIENSIKKYSERERRFGK